MRIAFIAWNRFQVAQIAPVLRDRPDEVVLIYQSDRPAPEASIIESPPDWCSVLVMKRSEIAQLDGVFDVVLTQTALPEAAQFIRTRVIAVQYSMAKEQHQYGPWHFQADARLTYGRYSRDILSFYGNAYETGNPRIDVLFDGRFDHAILDRLKSGVDVSKPTVLYVPTWGQLSSFDDFAPLIEPLSLRYNVIVSGHHNTMLRERHRAAVVNSSGWATDPEVVPYLHRLADVVVSDYSGAIFDGLLAERPIVLFRPGHARKIGLENLTPDSIEIAEADAIGPTVGSPEHLVGAIEGVLTTNRHAAANAELRSRCFSAVGRSAEASWQAIEAIVADETPPPKTFRWTRRALAQAPAALAKKTNRN